MKIETEDSTKNILREDIAFTAHFDTAVMILTKERFKTLRGLRESQSKREEKQSDWQTAHHREAIAELEGNHNIALSKGIRHKKQTQPHFQLVPRRQGLTANSSACLLVAVGGANHGVVRSRPVVQAR